MTQTPQSLDDAPIMPARACPSLVAGVGAGQKHILFDSPASPDRKTVLYVSHTAVLGGGEIALLRLLRHIDRQRYRPLVVLGEDGPLRAKLTELDIETHVLPLAGDVAHTRKDGMGTGAWLHVGKVGRTMGYAVRLARFMRRHKVDLVHANTLKADVFGGIAARLASLSVIWHVRDRIADDYLPGPTARVFRRLCRTLPTCVITNSHATLYTLDLPARLQPAADMDASTFSRFRVIHDGVEDTDNGPAEGIPATGWGEHVPALFHTPLQNPDHALIGMVGRLSPWKGQHVFIAAARLVHARYPGCRFQIVGSALFGEAEYAQQIHAQADAPELGGCVELLGFRDDVPRLMRTFDVLVHASTLGEPFGQVVVEGMAASRPVVASRAGAIPEIVQEGVTGLMVTPGDAEALADALMSLLADPPRAARMGQAGRARALEHFSIQNTARKVQAVYHTLLAQNAPHN